MTLEILASDVRVGDKIEVIAVDEADHTWSAVTRIRYTEWGQVCFWVADCDYPDQIYQVTELTSRVTVKRGEQ